MDGIARNTAGLDVELSGALGPVLGAVLLLVSAVLALALIGEVLRRSGRALGFVRGIDRALPCSVRKIATAVVALAATFVGPVHAYAVDAPVRGWLSGSASTSTTMAPRPPPRGTVATEDELAARGASTSTTAVTTATTSPLPVVAVPPAPAPAAMPAPTTTPGSPVADGGTRYVVVEGDCLWAIAAERLGSGTTDVEIDAAWRALYLANRAAIGDDPNLILPGLQLELPPIDRLRDAP